MYFSATIFAAIGFKSPTATALLIACTNFAFTVAAFLVIDRIGRRRILLFSIPLMSFGLFLSAIAFMFQDIQLSPPPPSSEPSSTSSLNSVTNAVTKSPVLVLPPLLLFVAAYALGLGNVPWQQPELFSSSVRALGAALATSTNWAANAVVGATFLPLVEVVGAPVTLMGYAAICLVIWGAVWAVFPERMGRELESVGGVGEGEEDD
jgi:MFS transporter, SP family, solute carrier family 2 (myo-inositol transporter), member 13